MTSFPSPPPPKKKKVSKTHKELSPHLKGHWARQHLIRQIKFRMYVPRVDILYVKSAYLKEIITTRERQHLEEDTYTI